MARITKRILDPDNLRRLPEQGFSWLDRRFVRDGFADALTLLELALYWFLCSVADRDGLSFYGDARAARLLKVSLAALEQARRGLIQHGLIAYQHPLYQVLSLPERNLPHLQPQRSTRSTGMPRLLGDILKELR
ncbi:MAG: hypothetical protein AB1486_15765 [Planctomycetota bacterium]